MTSQTDIIQSLPEHLRPFVAIQNYENYTSRDHAIWRFLLHQLKFSLRKNAHPTYFEGLEKTGINAEAIPRIEEINICLNQLGWKAVAVDGFLPPAVFMEFQALKVLAIALNIRSFEHMLYTPAPDIIHESAGHAPFLVDVDYAEFLQRFGELGMQAVANQHDMNIYEAIRQLSIIKESPESTPTQIEQAQTLVEGLQNTKVTPSEANLLARLHWWTVEYGLVGDTSDYKIFGAGLLSSLAESQSCLDDQQVQKQPLTVNVIHSPYDITIPQPQLFVTDSCRHLCQILEEYARHMCCQRGGTSALNEAQSMGTINTTTLNSGIQIAGKISRIITDAVGNAIYMNTQGPTQLAYQNSELSGHGIDVHASGFGSPIGRVRAIENSLSKYTVDELKRHGIEIDQTVTLNFLSGITVSGELKQIVRRDQKNILFSFIDCTVTDLEGDILFNPEWGSYDMVVGDSVVSVSGGSADQSTYPMYESPSQQVTINQDYDDATLALFDRYSELRNAREQESSWEHIVQEIEKLDAADWLLVFEAYELSGSDKLKQQLVTIAASAKDDVAMLIKGGLNRLEH
jgi:phenylalanine-4-hydroxylase